MQPLLARYPLGRGAHASRRDGLCTMELVAWLAGEEHTDSPRCACPVLSAFVRAINDLLPSDAVREQLLRPLAPRLVGSRTSVSQQQARGLAIADHAARVTAPLVLVAHGAVELAATLRTSPAIVDPSIAAALVAKIPVPPLRPTAWLLARAADGMPAERYVPAAAQTAWLAGAQGWQAAVKLLNRLLRQDLDPQHEHPANDGAGLHAASAQQPARIQRHAAR